MFVGFFFAFAVKAPMWPVHTWLPDAATEARPATAVLLVGMLDKVGTYGMIRFCLQLFPEAAKWATPVIITLAVVSVIYGALLAIGQTDMMRLIAFTSISHFGFIVLGIFALTTVGGAGSTLYMVNHGFSTAGLFLLAGFLVARRGLEAHPRLRRLAAGDPGARGQLPRRRPVQPRAARAVLVRVRVPRPAGHVHALPGGRGHRDARHRARRAVHPPHVPARHDRAEASFAEGESPHDLSSREKAVVVPIIASFLVLGFFPKPVLDLLNPAVERTLQYVGVTDPRAADASGSTK